MSNAPKSKLKLGVALQTRLELITRQDGSWRIWTGVKDKGANFDDMSGTYVRIDPDGSVWHCNVAPDGYHDCYEVKGKDNDQADD